MVKSKKSVSLVPIINTDQYNKILVVYQNGAYLLTYSMEQSPS